ncbi:MAG: GNAT family N-acetyltransferase [Gemmatimonadales bacterium]|jgi:amino-acid N-acetyltransferase
MTTDITTAVTVRPARDSDIEGITSLVNGYAAEAIMLYRSPESVRMTLHDFVVAVDANGAVMACGALKEYSPSLAEVASVAVARDAHGLGLGTAIVGEVERLARKRGVDELFALTLTPKFFESAGYIVADRALYPEKIRRDCLKCPRRIRCNEYCVVRPVQEEVAVAA